MVGVAHTGTRGSHPGIHEWSVRSPRTDGASLRRLSARGVMRGGCARGLAQVLVAAAFCKGRHARTGPAGARGHERSDGGRGRQGHEKRKRPQRGPPRAGRRTERHPKRHEQGAGPTHARADLEKTPVSYSFLATKARGPDRTENRRPMTCGFPEGLKPFALARPKNYRKRRLLSVGTAPSRQSGPSKAARSTRPFLATEPTPSCTLSH